MAILDGAKEIEHGQQRGGFRDPGCAQSREEFERAIEQMSTPAAPLPADEAPG